MPRTIHEAFISYYLAMRPYEEIGASSDQRGNLWLRLVWFYEDIGARELALQDAEQGRMYFAETESSPARSAAGEPGLNLLLGELDLRLGHQGEAFRNFHAAATMRGGAPRLKRMASDRIQDLRTR